ncbi:MAG: hypothetical protein ACTHMG_10585 [Sphingomonas sp.]
MVSSKIFRSRWSALLWAGGIIWTAYDVAEANAPHHHVPAATTADQPDHPAQEGDVAAATGGDVTQQDLDILNKYAGGSLN